jgi:hypothetical protein
MAKTKDKPKPVRKIDPQTRNGDFPFNWNLVCANGHYHYSEEPMTWVNYPCGHRYFNEKTGRRATCNKPQMLLKDYKPERKPKPVQKRPPKAKKRKRIVPRY